MDKATTHAGCSFPTNRQAIKDILEELDRQKKSSWDVVVGSDKLEFKMVENQFVLQVTASGKTELVPVTSTVHRQVANWMGWRMSDRYYKWAVAHSPQWCRAINDYIWAEPQQRLVRCMKSRDNTLYCRALLSDRYQIIPHSDYFFAVYEALKDAKAEIWHARLSDDHFFLYAVAPGITGQVSLDRTFDPGDGWISRWAGKEGDIFNAAISASNSETGEGGCVLSQAILRRVCMNYCVWHDLVNKTHVGKRLEADTLLSKETIEHRNAYFFGSITDNVAGAFNPDEFQRLVEQMNGATTDVIRDAEAAARALQAVYNISEERKDAIRDIFLRENDNSRYGLANAVTKFAQVEPSPEVGYGLEQLGASLFATDMTSVYRKANAIIRSKEEASVV